MFDPADGIALAVMDGTRITAARTGAAAAVAAGALARPDAAVLAILGAGVQGRSHLDAFPLVRDFREIRVYSRDPGHAAALAEAPWRPGRWARSRRRSPARTWSPAAPTPANRSWRPAGWPPAPTSARGRRHLRPRARPAIPRAGRVFVEWRGAATNPPRPAPTSSRASTPWPHRDRRSPAGTRPGRTGADELTVYKSTGHAVEDAAAADLVYRRALESGTGVRVVV